MTRFGHGGIGRNGVSENRHFRGKADVLQSAVPIVTSKARRHRE
jgi:hypothetical protein